MSPKLLEVLTREGLPPLAYQKAGEALVGRRDATSADTLAAALRLHADYADARQAPPVELLAKAVAALGPNGLSGSARAGQAPPAPRYVLVGGRADRAGPRRHGRLGRRRAGVA